MDNHKVGVLSEEQLCGLVSRESTFLEGIQPSPQISLEDIQRPERVRRLEVWSLRNSTCPSRVSGQAVLQLFPDTGASEATEAALCEAAGLIYVRAGC